MSDEKAKFLEKQLELVLAAHRRQGLVIAELQAQVHLLQSRIDELERERKEQAA